VTRSSGHPSTRPWLVRRPGAGATIEHPAITGRVGAGGDVYSRTVERRVLIIEEDPDVRRELARALELAGARAELASDGVAGLARLREGPVPSVILLDLRTPRLRGEEFLREVRRDPRYEGVPVITMTVGSDRTAAHDLVAHLRKPFDLDDLLAIILSLSEADAA
jgi:CheY-like chemotaxis protein